METLKITPRTFYGFLLSCLLLSCGNAGKQPATTTSRLAGVKTGMSFIDVIEIAGFPDQKINVGTTTDAYGLETKTEEWHYGDNELVVIVNDTVVSIDHDLQATYRRIQHIIDSAKAAGDTSKMIQPVN